MKVIPYILYLYLLAFHETVLSDLIGVYGATVNLVVLMVVMVALYRNVSTALWFAACAAIIVGTPHPGLMTWQMLTLVTLSLVVSRISGRVNLESLSSRLLILGGFLLIHQGVISFLTSSDNPLFVIYRMILPTAVYSLVIGWIIFLMIDGRVTWRKVKALF
jgi:hypothetical protein